MKRSHTLWTKNFSCITLATVLSIIGGEVMTLPLSLLVFENTRSTMLSAVIMVCGMLPDVFLSVLIAPFIDKGNKKRWIISMDLLLAAIYLLVGLWVANQEFQYMLYVLLSLAIGTISVFYRLAYSAWYPDLIPIGFEQKGYAISGTIYPLITIVMTPLATFLYELLPIHQLFFMVTAITLIAVLIESLVRVEDKEKTSRQSYSFTRYKADIREGFSYFKKEKGIRNIYTYMAISSGTFEGTNIAIQAYYQSSPWLSVTMLGFLKSAEMVGRLLGGLIQYKVTVPPKKRYGVTKFVYITYQLADMVLLFTPYPLMLLNRFLCGGLGNTSATIRETAVQSYLPETIRARVNALFNAMFSVGGVLFQIIAGVLGEFLSYRSMILILGFIGLAAIWALIIRPGNVNRTVYEAERK